MCLVAFTKGTCSPLFHPPILSSPSMFMELGGPHGSGVEGFTISDTQEIYSFAHQPSLTLLPPIKSFHLFSGSASCFSRNRLEVIMQLSRNTQRIPSEWLERVGIRLVALRSNPAKANHAHLTESCLELRKKGVKGSGSHWRKHHVLLQFFASGDQDDKNSSQ